MNSLPILMWKCMSTLLIPCVIVVLSTEDYCLIVIFKSCIKRSTLPGITSNIV